MKQELGGRYVSIAPSYLDAIQGCCDQTSQKQALLLQTQHHLHVPVSLNWVRERILNGDSGSLLEIIHVQCKSPILVLYISRTEWILRRSDRLSREVGKPGPVGGFPTCSQLNRDNKQIHNWEPALSHLIAIQCARRKLGNQWHERLKL